MTGYVVYHKVSINPHIRVLFGELESHKTLKGAMKSINYYIKQNSAVLLVTEDFTPDLWAELPD